MIECKDSLQFLKEQEDFSIDINYSDPPYGLGSTVIIRPDGKPDYSKASDFMSKWDMPTGDYWEEWFKESYRTLKHGGYCIMFGMDRQLLLFKYYASLAGLQERQSMYWYFISNFPKASDLSKNLDKNAGAEREVIGTDEKFLARNPKSNHKDDFKDSYGNPSFKDGDEASNITAPSTPLAKKYSGYKYSISPLKQTNETIMVFQKPYKTGSCLHDTLAYENGDTECGCGALNIEKGRVPSEQGSYDIRHYTKEDCFQNLKPKESKFQVKSQPSGRYPAQTFCDSQASLLLDEQSGTKTSKKVISARAGKHNTGRYGDFKGQENVEIGHNDTGGCSKILHHCDYQKDNYNLYQYQAKVSKKERNAGCEGMEEKECKTGIDTEGRTNNDLMERFRKEPQTNNHPTLKPISLNRRILQLFKTPNPQKIIFPFAGSGSEVIGGIQAGFTDWTGCELSQEYIDIANARIKYYTNREKEILL